MGGGGTSLAALSISSSSDSPHRSGPVSVVVVVLPQLFHPDQLDDAGDGGGGCHQSCSLCLRDRRYNGVSCAFGGFGREHHRDRCILRTASWWQYWQRRR